MTRFETSDWPSVHAVLPTTVIAGGNLPEVLIHGSGTVTDWLMDLPGCRLELLATTSSWVLAPDEVLSLVRRARDLAAREGPVVLVANAIEIEEIAALCSLMHCGPSSIVLVSVHSQAEASVVRDVLDAVVVAGGEAPFETGVFVCAGGRLYAADRLRWAASYALNGYESHQSAAPLGCVQGSRVAIYGDMVRRAAAIDPCHLMARVAIVTPGLGTEADWVQAAVDGLEGMVVTLPGDGQADADVLRVLSEASEAIPVVACPRSLHGTIRNGRQSLEPERDVRLSGAICAGALSAVQARMKLVACLGAGLSHGDIRERFVPDDQ